LSLLTPLLLLENLVLLFAQEILTPFFGRFFLKMTILVLSLVFLHDLVSSLLGLGHLVSDVKFHIVDSHLHNVVGLIDLLKLLLCFVAEYFDFRFATFLCLFEFIIFGLLLTQAMLL
jgi:hypothetical protein